MFFRLENLAKTRVKEASMGRFFRVLSVLFLVSSAVTSPSFGQVVHTDPPPAGALVIEAETFDFEEGGKVARAVGRPGTTGECLTTWNNAGHVLGWTVQVPEAGEYTVTLRMAAGRSGTAYREIRIDGALPDATFARIAVKPSGGFGKELTHWRNITLGTSEGQAVSVVLSAGPHVFRMKNLGGEAEDGGVNLDQFFLVRAPAGTLKAVAVAPGNEPAPPAPLVLDAGLVIDAAFAGPDGEMVAGRPRFSTLRAALKRIPASNTRRITIGVLPGRYRELVRLTVANITVVGLGTRPDEVVFTYDLSAGTPVSASDPAKTFGTSGSVSFLVSADGFRARNVTFENSWDPDAHPGAAGTQAVAFRVNGSRAVLDRCRFLGHQDTLYADQGLHYFTRCWIQGDVDFIFGSGQSVFEDCDIVSLARAKAAAGGWSGYVAAPSTRSQQPWGYLFLRSRLLAAPGVPAGSVALGRPWRPSSDASAVPSAVFRECELGPHIAPQGWTDMGESRAATARLFELANTGPGAHKAETRRQVPEAEASRYTASAVLAGWDYRSDLSELTAAEASFRPGP